MANEETKRSYTKTAFSVPAGATPEKLDGVYGYVEGFVKSVKIRTANTRNGERKVADVNLDVAMSDKRVEKLFGKDFVNGFNVRFRISYWGLAAENLEKYPPQVNQKMICLIENLKLRVDTKDDKTFRTVQATGVDFASTNSRMKENGTSALNADGNNQKAAAPGANDKIDLEDDFAELNEFTEDSELPF